MLELVEFRQNTGDDMNDPLGMTAATGHGSADKMDGQADEH